MTFGSPGYLWFFALPLAAYAVTLWWLLWRAHARTRFGGLRQERGAASFAGPAALLLAMAIIVFAAARPQWGSHAQPSDDKGIDVAIVLDVSNSMLADDVTPSRLARAQSELGALIDRMQGDRVGLVIFAGDSFVRSPLTPDLRALRLLVDGVGSERGLVAPGSDLGHAIRTGQQLLAAGDAKTNVILVVSDGEDRADDVTPPVAAAHAAGTLIYTAGAGTAAGAPVRDVDPVTHASTPRIGGDGAPVVTRLDEAMLKQIAAAGGGRYVALSDPGSLAGLAAELDRLQRTRFDTKAAPQPIERFQWFAILGLLLIAAEIVLPPLLRQPRSALRSAGRLWPLATAGLLVGGVCSASVAEINRHGNDQYAQANYAPALDLYRTAQAVDSSRAETFYNGGNALDQQGDYARAIDEARRGPSAPANIVDRAQYALGNHYAGAVQLANAIEAYKRALLADPNDADAKHNLEVITARLTPSPSPTPSPTSPPNEGTPTPGARGTPSGASTSASGQRGSPQAGATSAAGGTPSPADDAQLTPEELQRRLADALAGINKQFSEEDALRALDLLNEANRRSVEQFQAGTHPGTAADY